MKPSRVHDLTLPRDDTRAVLAELSQPAADTVARRAIFARIARMTEAGVGGVVLVAHAPRAT